MEITEEDIRNNPGVDINEIKEEKSKYHFHKLASVTLSGSVLHCIFQVDTDPTSLYYCLPEGGFPPVREFYIGNSVDGEVVVMKDGLSVRVGEQYFSSEEIFSS